MNQRFAFPCTPKNILAALLLTFLGATSGQASEYRLGKAVLQFPACSESPSDCFRKATAYLNAFKIRDDQQIETLEEEARLDQWTTDHLTQERQGTRIMTRDHRTPIAALIIHGYAMDSRQFSMEQAALTRFGINTVNITLPGHGPYAENHETLTYQDWLKAAREGLTLIQALGDRVILMGHSTGGELSLAMALEQPHAVQGLILVDPGFRIQKRIQWGSCLGKSILGDARDLGWLADIFHHGASTNPNPASMNMGCEVTRLTKDILQRFGHSESDSEDDEPSFEKLFPKVHVPVLLSYTSNDTVVGTDTILKMAQINRETTWAYDWVYSGATEEERSADHGKNSIRQLRDKRLMENWLVRMLKVPASELKNSAALMDLRSAYRDYLSRLPKAATCARLIRELSVLQPEQAREGLKSAEARTKFSSCLISKTADEGLDSVCSYFNPELPSCKTIDNHFARWMEFGNLGNKLSQQSSGKVDASLLDQAIQISHELGSGSEVDHFIFDVSRKAFAPLSMPAEPQTEQDAARLMETWKALPSNYRPTEKAKASGAAH